MIPGGGEDLAALVPRLTGRRVAVVGDVCLDEYIVGRARRLSREAPVPVLEFQERWTLPGAAANPAHNLRALGSEPVLLSVVGCDPTAAELRQRLRDLGIADDGLIATPDRQTTRKTRLLAEVSLRFPQHVARIDYPERRPLTPALRQAVLDRLAAVLPTVEAVLVSDYRSGVIDPVLAAEIRALAHRAGRPVTVDSQGNLTPFRGYDLLKANQAETEQYLGRELPSEVAVTAAAREIRDRLTVKGVVITRGPEGLALVWGEECWHVPAVNRTEVYDVTGAGDTVIAVLTLALAAGLPPLAGAYLASLAAGQVVRRLGNAVVTPAELMAVARSLPG